MALRDIVLGIGLDAKKFDVGMAKVRASLRSINESQLGHLTKGLSGIVTPILSGLSAIASKIMGLAETASIAGVGIIATIGGAAAWAIKKGLEEAKVDDVLKHTLGKLGQSGAFAQIDELSQKMQKAFGFEDDDARAAMSKLISGGMTVKQAMSSMGIVMDIAKKKQIEVSEATQLWWQIWTGQATKAAKALGIRVAMTGDKLKDVASLQAEIYKQYGGYAASVEESSRPFAKILMMLDDMVTAIGRNLIPAVMPFFQTMLEFVVGATGHTDALATSIGEIGKSISQWLKGLWPQLVYYGLVAWNTIQGLPAALQKMPWFDVIAGICGGILIIIGRMISTASKMVMLELNHIGDAIHEKMMDFVPGGGLARKGLKALGLGGLNAQERGQESNVFFKQSMRDAAAAAKAGVGDIGLISADAFGVNKASTKAQRQMPGVMSQIDSIIENGRNAIAQGKRDVAAMPQVSGASPAVQQEENMKRMKAMAGQAEQYNAQAQMREPIKFEMDWTMSNYDSNISALDGGG